MSDRAIFVACISSDQGANKLSNSLLSSLNLQYRLVVLDFKFKHIKMYRHRKKLRNVLHKCNTQILLKYSLKLINT